MTKVILTEDHLEDIADAIRAKLGVSTQYKPGQMAAAIQTIAPQPTLQQKSVTANGTVTPDSGYDGLSQVTVNVPNSYGASDEGKVVSNGELVAQTARASEITANGTYDTTKNNSVTVNVSGGGGGDPFAGLTAYIESSGTQYINTGYTIAANTRFEVVANVPDNSSAFPALFGERASVSSEVVIFVEFNGGGIGMIWANGDSSFAPNFWNRGYIGKKCEYVLGAAGEVGIRDADNYGFKGTRTTGTGASLPVYLFVLNENNNPNSVTYCAAKLYRFRVYEGDALVMELLPFVDGNNVACLKDTVSENLFYNSGSGSFTYGTDA